MDGLLQDSRVSKDVHVRCKESRKLLDDVGADSADCSPRTCSKGTRTRYRFVDTEAVKPQAFQCSKAFAIGDLNFYVLMLLASALPVLPEFCLEMGGHPPNPPAWISKASLLCLEHHAACRREDLLHHSKPVT